MTDDPALRGLYPFLHGGAKNPADEQAALLESVRRKAADSVSVKQAFFERHAEDVVTVARAIAGCYRNGGMLFSMGNGGSSCDASHIAARSGCRLVIDLDRVPLAEEATIDDLGFGEDYELLAAVAVSGPLTVVGRCEQGEGVELLLDGQPYELSSWEHFR